MTVEVLVEIKGIDKTFTYAVPVNLEKDIKIGMKVTVPFGNRKLEGFVLACENKKVDYELKDIISLSDVVLSEELISLAKYMSRKTLATLASSLSTMLPKAIKASYKTNISKKYITYLKLNKENLNLVNTNKQQEIIDLFKEDLVLKSDAAKISISALKTLISKNILIEEEKEVFRYNSIDKVEDKKVILTKEQENAYQTIKNSLSLFKPFLIHGVTGSGKTEVYMHLIKDVLESGKNVIVLVPEISLTPQVVNLFKARFSNIAVLHSKLSDGERYDEYRKINEGLVNIVVGARSAIFAPFKNIGLIIIDEEHTDTYKQENTPRYHAIDMALYRAKYNNCPLVLGSATPSIESYTRALLGTYTLINMPTRVNKNLPKVFLVDMRDEYKKGNRVFSSLLTDELNETIKNGKQAIILLNRRGFNTILTCNSCGYVSKCPKCDIPLTYHKKNNVLRCHYCGYATSKMIKCPNCKSEDITYTGMGTEKLEELIKENFIGAKVLRMDVDTTSLKGAHERIISSFRKGEANILLGTQMISKGLDFPNVTLVGVINGDASLNIPDFRASERTFDLLSQVSGRAGRSNLKGKVIIQTFNPDNKTLLNVLNHDYMSNYNYEMDIRRKLKYPPYYYLISLKVTSKKYDVLSKEVNKIADYIRKNVDDTTIVLGPTTAAIFKINNIMRFQITIKYRKDDKLFQTLKDLDEQYIMNKDINLELDIDPLRI